MALYQHRTTSKPLPRTTLTEFEILKNAHRFLRDEDDSSRDVQNQSWDEQLASKYYASLYREFAVCDLKHYKSGNFALRWRTESEVLSGAGETTCGNTRCEHHHPLPEYLRRSAGPASSLTTLELPFAYEEHGENKSALVKMVLCKRCVDKLMWKRRNEKGKAVKDEIEEGTEMNGSPRSGPMEDRQGKIGKKAKTEEVDEAETTGNDRRMTATREDEALGLDHHERAIDGVPHPQIIVGNLNEIIDTEMHTTQLLTRFMNFFGS
ncbi:hypothetical protein C0995_010720 [Termitomyces sp. Mi166|nr:hypothetical protein C0995_010720 [Termitomyces sp. Mi166\